MRQDMHELLVERPRWAHAARYPRAFVRNRSAGARDARGASDDLPAREALSRSRYGDKQLSENFAPLVRFLRRNVGRPWAKVHSEMAQVLAPSNAVQRHVLVHVADFLVVTSPARAKRPPNPNVHELSPTRQLRRINGLWYELECAPFPAWPDRARCVDVVSRRRVRWETYDLFPEMKDLWESGRYAIAKRQVGKRELRDRVSGLSGS